MAEKKRLSKELTKERPRRKRTKKSSSQTDEEDDLLSGQSVLKLDEYFPREIPLGLCGDKFRCNDPFMVSLHLFYETKNINV